MKGNRLHEAVKVQKEVGFGAVSRGQFRILSFAICIICSTSFNRFAGCA